MKVTEYEMGLSDPPVSLTAPNCNHFAQVSLMVLDNFFDAINKAKNLICKSIAQNLKRVSLTNPLLLEKKNESNRIPNGTS